MSNHITLSVCDFKKILYELKFMDNLNDLLLCINCKDEKIYFKFIFKEVNISTYHLNDNIIIDSTDILLMFEYKLISNIIENTNSGTIKFQTIGKKIQMTINTSFELKKTFLNTIDDQLLGTLEVLSNSIRVDSHKISTILKYFINDNKNLSSYFLVNYLYISVENSKMIFKNENLTVEIKINTDLKIEASKLHIDCLYNFIQTKKSMCDIYISSEYPIICRLEGDYGHLELYSAHLV